MLIFQNDTMDEICSHAQREYPKECCGIMLGSRLGKQRVVCRVIQTGNVAGECRTATHFLISPLDIVKAELLAEKEKLEMIGFYHSHPDYEAVASNTDVHYMLAGYSYPIISVRKGICDEVKSFERITQTDTYVKEEKILIKEKKNADFSICISNAADLCK